MCAASACRYYNSIVRKPWAAAAAALLGVLLAVNIYRAATQSITIDEAFTYNLYLSQPLKDTFTHYDANNHVLYTLLARISLGIFGHGEFPLRLPSLLGGLLYFVALFRLSRRWFGHGPLLLLSTAVLSLNPFVLDYLSAARGYGLALGLYLYGLDRLIASWSAGPYARDTHRAGVAFGLAIAANLAFLFPVAAAGMVCLVFDHRRIWRVVNELALPAIVVAGLILMVPLANATPQHFYYGAKSLAETSESVVFYSLIHVGEPGLERFREAVLFLAHRAVPVLIALLALGWGAIALRRRGRDDADRAAVFLAATLVVTLAVLIAAHGAAGVMYPLGRTGVYFVPLLLLPLVAAVAKLWPGRWTRPVAVLAALALFACTAVFLLRWNTRVYGEWTFDAGTRDIVRRIALGHPKPGTRVGGTWLLEPSVNFYRQTWRLDWMKPVERGAPDGDYDFYVLGPEDAGVVEKRGLVVIHRDAVSGATLARRR